MSSVVVSGFSRTWQREKGTFEAPTEGEVTNPTAARTRGDVERAYPGPAEAGHYDG